MVLREQRMEMRDRLIGLPVEGLDHPVLLDRAAAFRGGQRGQVAGPPTRAERDVVDGLVSLGFEPLDQLGDVRGEHGPLLGPLERQGALRRRGDADTAEHQGGHRGDRDEEQQPGAHPPVLQAGAPRSAAAARAAPRDAGAARAAGAVRLAAPGASVAAVGASVAAVGIQAVDGAGRGCRCAPVGRSRVLIRDRRCPVRRRRAPVGHTAATGPRPVAGLTPGLACSCAPHQANDPSLMACA